MQFLIILAIVAGSVVLLSVGVILRKDHKFRSEHISENKLMRERGIECATAQDRKARKFLSLRNDYLIIDN